MFIVPDLSARHDRRSESLEFETEAEILEQIKLLADCLLAGGMTVGDVRRPAPPATAAEKKPKRKPPAKIEDKLVDIAEIMGRMPGIKMTELSLLTGIPRETLQRNADAKRVIDHARGSGQARAREQYRDSVGPDGFDDE